VLIDGNQQLLQTVRGPGTRILRSLFPQPLDSTLEEAFRNRRPLYTANFAESAMTTDTLRLAAQKVGGYSLLQVPMFWQGRGIGAIYVSRLPNVAFSDKEVALLTTFADHAVIAIQNARLFNETKEALEQQKASADILSVISNSVADTQPVFDKILSSIEHLFGGDERFVLLAGEDDLLHIGAVHGPSAERARALFPVPLQGSASEVAMRERRLVAHADVFNDPDVPPVLRETARRFGSNYAMVVAPMLWEDRAIGSIFVGRTSMEPFGERECALLRTFADQAVIAIENARLFNETKEALERQTATADILKVIASSPSDVQPVFEAIAASSNRLIAGLSTAVHRVIDDALHLAAFTRTTPAGDAALQASFPRPLSSAAWGENIRNGETVHIPDVEIEWAGQPTLLEMARLRRFRSLLFVPLLRHGTTIGIISVSRKEAGTFAPQYVLLLQTFADQAVIAIENVRLFNETKEALERQTATADILKVIASSPSDVQPVFEAIAASANRLVGGFSSTVFRLIDGIAHLKAFTPTTPAADKVLQDTFPRPAVDFPPFRMAQAGEVTRIPDTDALSDAIGDIARARGFRSMLFAPLMNDGVSIGLIAVTRVQPSNFTDHHVQLLQTFADQAVIAIENVRLFEEVQARTRELSRSLDDLRTAQDRLVQTEKLASLGQLTAGIAHEIKNPLNFVNNFAALSAELTDELNEVLKPATLAGDIREEVDELTGLLKDNLQKVVQHGKRADSIVKNMLLHSREGSGEHRPADINALLDESLNLAYHGARAEKPQFNVTLQRDFDALAGMVELFPQEITRVFLNLISNGFYAVSKRKTDNGETDFEPLLFAATRSLGDTVEIRIRDNGTGIPAEVKEKMFNPFFTTKPAGEGTGLGLSMSHDIIVKQHGGRIEVETEPGQFTEFRIVLPRTSRIANKDRGQT